MSPTGTLATVARSHRPDVRLAPVALAPFRRARPRTTPSDERHVFIRVESTSDNRLLAIGDSGRLRHGLLRR